MRMTAMLVAAALAGLTAPSVMAEPGRRATTAYTTRLMKFLPVKVTNHDHLYELGRGYMSIGRGTRYTLQVGKLKLGVTPRLGQRLDNWMFKRFVFGKQNVSRVTRASDGSVEHQSHRFDSVREANGTRTISRAGKTTIYEPDGSHRDLVAGKSMTIGHITRHQAGTWRERTSRPGALVNMNTALRRAFNAP